MMPPPIPPHFQLAKKRMRQGLHPAVVAAAQRAIEAEKTKLAGHAARPDPGYLPNDPATIRRFQQFHGVPATGHADAATQALMQRLRTTLGPAAGARRQVWEGTGVNPGHAPAATGGDARPDPLANQQFQRFLQKDPEGGLREVHVYGTGQNRQVRAFTRTRPVSTSVMQQLSNTATAHDKLLALAVRRAAAQTGGALARNPRKKRVFNYSGGGYGRGV
jgi:peptidoglycan hydrolase-like protein with peptidoglycan-binding domain